MLMLRFTFVENAFEMKGLISQFFFLLVLKRSCLLCFVCCSTEASKQNTFSFSFLQSTFASFGHFETLSMSSIGVAASTASQKAAPQLRQCSVHDAGNARARSFSSQESLAIVADVHSGTPSGSTPIQKGETATIACISVSAGSGGVLVQWDTKSGNVRLTASSAATAAGDWVRAARLVAKENARAVQLTILSPTFRVWVDGQRLARVGSPVLVHPAQRVSFATDATVYTIAPVAAPASRATVDVSRHQLPLAPAKARERRQRSHLRSSSPAPRVPVPCTQPTPPSPPPMISFSSVSGASRENSSSSSSSTCADAAAAADTAAQGNTCAVWTTGELVLPIGPEEEMQHRSPSLSSTLKTVTTPLQQPCKEVCAPEPLHVIPVVIGDRAVPSTPCASEPITSNEDGVAAVRDTTGTADVLTEVSAARERHMSDVLGLTSAIAKGRADMEGKTADAASQHEDAQHQLFFSSTATAITGKTLTDTTEEVHQQHQPKQHIAKSINAVFTWGPVVSVASPDWSLLAAAWPDPSNEKVEVEEEGGASAAAFDSCADAFAAALHSRCTLPKQKAAAGAARHARQRHSAGNGPLNPARRASLTAALALSSLISVSPRPSQHSSSSSLGKALAGYPENRRASVKKLSSHTSSSEWAGRLGWEASEAHASRSDTAQAKEKLRLRQRVAVAPFVVEMFGSTHRYRPLVRKPAAVDSSDEEIGDTGLTTESLSDSIEQARATTEARQEQIESPWIYPSVADELVTPHTEAVLQRALCFTTETTTAAKSASFLHDALRRTYDAATDHFTYTTIPGLPDLLYSAFMTVSEELLGSLREGRPVRRLSSPLLCAGDLFGSFKDLLMVLGSAAHFTHWSMMHLPLVLLGNYVDVGWHSVEVVLLLCSWAYLQPLKVHLLRGPHEDPCVNGSYAALGKRCLRYKCRQRFGGRKGVALWRRLNRIFALLPVAAVVDGSVFVAHGGVPLLLPSPLEEGARAGDDAAAHLTRGPQQWGEGEAALYSNTSGVPTLTTDAAESTLSTSSPYVDPQRSPSAVRAPPRAATSHSDSRQRTEGDPHGGRIRSNRRNTSRQQKGGRNMRANVRSSSKSAVDAATAAAAATVKECISGQTVEKELTADQRVTAASAVDTLAEHSEGTSSDAPSSPFSLGTLPSTAEKVEVVPRCGTATSAVWRSCPTSHDSETLSGGHEAPLPETSAPPVPPPAPAVAHEVGGAAYGALLNFVTPSGPSQSQISLSDAANIVEYHRSRTPLLPRRGGGCDGGAASVAMPDDASSAWMVDARSAEEPVRKRSAACSSLSTLTAAASLTTGHPSAVSQPSSSAFRATHHDIPSEADFERLLLATNMSAFSFDTLQSNSDDDDEACRRRLIRELVWNRPRDAAARFDAALGKTHAAEDTLEPSWGMPREVQCCHVCPPASATHDCCHVFGSGALVHFLDRFNLSLVVRGAPEDTSDIYGALLSEEGRLLSLLTCTRLYRQPMQAGACVLHPQSFQLAVWGSQQLADSRGPLSRHFSDPHGMREGIARFCSFLEKQVQVRLRDHGMIGPQNRWGLVSACDEFKRQQALKRRLDLNA